MRTEIAILAFAVFLKKMSAETRQPSSWPTYIDYSLYALCGLVIIMAILSLVQCSISLSKLGVAELPTASSKKFVIFSGIVGVLLCILSSVIIIII
jgi:uncharacterized membrane protein YidH (DUF202 family)